MLVPMKIDFATLRFALNSRGSVRRAVALALTGAALMSSPLASAQSTLNDRAIVMGVLAAEFALQEGDLATAAATYSEMARRSRDPKVSERAVELLLRARRADEAKEIVAIWQASDATSPRANQIALALALNSNDEVGALKAVSNAVGFPVEMRATAILDLSRQIAQYKNRDFAVRLASVFTATLPDLAESHYALSIASTGTDYSRINDALISIDRALAIKPNWPQAVAVKARLLQARDEKSSVRRAYKSGADSLKLLEDAVAANDESRELKLMLARAKFDDGKFAEARKLFLDLSDDGTGDGEEMRLSATLAAFSAQDWETAESEFNAAIAEDRGDAGAIRYYLGRISEARKRWAEAAERYAKVPKTGQGDRYWESQLRLAGALASDKRTLQALSHLQTLTPKTVREKSTYAQTESMIWREAGDNVKALGALDQAILADDKDMDLLYESAILADRIGDPAESERRLRKVLAVAPDRPDANNALGYALADRGEKLTEARALIEKAHAALPDDPAILDSMGWIAFREGRLQEAEQYLRQSLAKFADGEIAAHLGEVLWAQGRKDEARVVWRAQLLKQPDSEILKKTMKRLDP